MVRKLIDLYKAFGYEQFKGLNGIPAVTTLTLDDNWFPTRRTLLGGRVLFLAFDPR